MLMKEFDVANRQIGSQEYKGRVTTYDILSCAVAASGGIIFGYDLGVSGGLTSMEPFLKKFFPDVYTKMKKDTAISNYCKFNSQKLTSFTSSFYIASLFALFLVEPITRIFRRKPSILIGGAAFFAGAALGGAAHNVYMIIFGRALLEVGIGFTNQAVPLYLSEMAPSKYRGILNSSFQLNTAIGALSANLINFGSSRIATGWGWRLSLAMAAAPASLLTLGIIFLPETPNSIIQHSLDNCNEAREMLRRIRGVDDVEDEIEDLIQASKNSKSIKNPLKTILKERKYRPHLVRALAIPFFQQVTGINVIASYAPILFRAMGFGKSASVMSSIATGLTSIGSTAISMLMVDKLGWRFLFMLGGAQMFFMQIMVGGIMASEIEDKGEVSKGVAVLLLVLICIYVAGYAWSWGPLGVLVPSEIFPLEIRSTAQSISQAVSFFFTLTIAQTFLSMLCHFKYGVFFFFGGWVVVMTGLVYFMLPETKNRGIEQMHRVWGEHWFWRRIVEHEIYGSMKMETPIWALWTQQPVTPVYPIFSFSYAPHLNKLQRT